MKTCTNFEKHLGSTQINIYRSEKEIYGEMLRIWDEKNFPRGLQNNYR